MKQRIYVIQTKTGILCLAWEQKPYHIVCLGLPVKTVTFSCFGDMFNILNIGTFCADDRTEETNFNKTIVFEKAVQKICDSQKCTIAFERR